MPTEENEKDDEDVDDDEEPSLSINAMTHTQQTPNSRINELNLPSCRPVPHALTRPLIATFLPMLQSIFE